MKKLLYLCALAVTAFATACSDNSTENNSGQAPDGVDTLVQRQQFLDSAAADNVVRNLYDVTTVAPSTDSTYVLKYGEHLKESGENTYYVACRNAVDALNFFKFNCSNQSEDISLSDTLATNLQDCECDFGKWGKTSLHFGDKNPIYATITINMTAVGQMHTICFVPQAYIDDNNSDKPAFRSPYEMGNVVQDESGVQWLCVKPTTAGSNGLLVRMVQSGYRVSNIHDEAKTVYYREPQTEQLADRVAWQALLYGANYMDFDDAYNAILQKQNGIKMDDLLPVIKYLKGISQPGWLTVQQVGKAYGIQKRGHWWLWMSVWNCGWYPLYEIQLPFVRLENGKNIYIGTSSSCKEFNTCDGRISNTTLQTGPQLVQREFYTDELPNSKVLWPIDYH